MPSVVVKSGAKSGNEFPLQEGLNRIGRAPGNDIRLEDAGVSAAHCEIWVMRERLLVRDLGSTNGTFVDGRSVSEGELHEGTLVGVGGVLIEVHGAVPKVAIPKPPPPPPPAPRWTEEGLPCCGQHPGIVAPYRCSKCGEQFCADCVRFLARRGGERHTYCPLRAAECVAALPKGAVPTRAGWLAKLTQTLKLRR
jgi:hypothetical protein